MTKQEKEVSVIGLGKLGLPLALCFASYGYKVVGYDIYSSWIKALQEGKSPIKEAYTQELLTQCGSSIQFTTRAEDVIHKTNISFIVVPTPSEMDGSFSSTYIQEAIKTLSPFLKKKKQKHILVITSTISPQTTELTLAPLIEALTGMKVGRDMGLCYSPELIALGSVIQNIKKPDFIFIGESDPDSGKVVEQLRKSICENSPVIMRMNWINAEIAKLALNAYITMKISFANMIARISERVPGADSAIILNAIGQDSRIGIKYLKGGVGFGGPCFPRDNISLYSTIKKIGLDIQLPLNTDQFNRKQIDYVYKIMRKFLKKGNTVGILGLSYKPETDVIDESQGILLAQKLLERKVSIVLFDPLVLEISRNEFKKVLFMKTMEECVRKSRVIVLMTPWAQFKEINWDKYKGKVIIDCWRQINSSKYDQVQNTFVQLGKYISTP